MHCGADVSEISVSLDNEPVDDTPLIQGTYIIECLLKSGTHISCLVVEFFEKQL